MEGKGSIVYLTDFSKLANKGLMEAVSIAKRGGVKLIVLHVYHRLYMKSERRSDLSGLLKKKEKIIDNEFNDLKESIPQLNEIPYEFRKTLGFLEDEVVKISNEPEVRLLILSTKFSLALSQIWSTGSHTFEMINRVRIPVLLLPENSTFENINRIRLAYNTQIKDSSGNREVLDELNDLFDMDLEAFGINYLDEPFTATQVLASRKVTGEFVSGQHMTGHLQNWKDPDTVLLTTNDWKGQETGTLIAVHYSFLEQLFSNAQIDKLINRINPLLILK